MKKKIIISFIFSFFFGVMSFTTSAQEYKYDISKYYTPDIVRNQLDLSLSTNGSFSNQTASNDSLYYNSLYGTLSPTFEMYKNTRKLVSQFQASGNFQGLSSGRGNLNNNNNSLVATQSSSTLNIGYDIRFYNPKKQFLSLGIFGNFETTGNMNHFSVNSVKTKAGKRDFEGGIRPSIGIGFGRIEMVEDARQAIYILDELSKKGVLTRHLSNDEIFQFSQQISRVKNKRFLDSRLHLIEEITSVDSFFVSNNLLTKLDASYFATLYDNWQYGALYSRKSGHEFAISLSPSITLYSENSLSLDSVPWAHGHSNYYRGDLTLSYNYENPVSLNWQHSAGVTLNFNSTSYNRTTLPSTDSPSTTQKHRINNAYLYGNYYIRYYPSTRTNYSVGVTQYLLLSSYKDLVNLATTPSNYLSSSTMLYFNASYYFSPQLKLSGNADFGYNYQGSDTYKSYGLRGGFSASVAYSFF